MSRIDEAVIRWATVAYLWLLDATGVYVGTVMFVINILNVAWSKIVIGNKFGWLDVVYLAITFLWATAKFVLQHMGLHETYNADARDWTESPLRKPFVVTTIITSAVDLVMIGWRNAAVWSFYLAWVYMCCVQIRDRERREHGYWNWVMGGAT